MSNLKNKTAVVTGAGRGAGQAIALALGRAGARVAGVDVNPDAAQRTADAITQAGGLACAQTTDVSNKMAVQTMLYAMLEQWERIDILVNAAYVTPGSSALKLDEWEWNRVVEVNLKGVFLVSQTAARAMKESGGGIILNVLRSKETPPHAAVSAAREGLVGLTQALASEWAEFGVRVETVEAAPDPVETAEVVLRLTQPKTH